ncbi:MAG: M56 family metallopeptidase [Bacteroidota bacterium]
MTFTISILIKSTLILLLATALALALKKSSASLRHLVISLSLIALLLLPAFQYFTPAIEVEIPIVEQLELKTLPLVWEENTAANLPLETVEKESPEFIQQNVYVPNTEAYLPTIEESKGLALFQMDMDVKEALFWIWIVGSSLSLLRMLVQMARVWRTSNKSETISIDVAALGLSLNRNIRFLSNASIQTPMTFGLFKPKILLPKDAQNWPAEQLKIVLLHELAHIKRQDYLLHLIGLLTLSLFWFHPLVWLLQKWQQSEREKACDEYVLKQGISKTNYAESLVQVARNMLSKKTHRWQSSLPLAANSETKKRVLAILKFDLQNWNFTRWMQWRWVGCFACILPLLAAIHPATKEFVEENIPKIEAVLEQPVFVPKVLKNEEVEDKISSMKSNLEPKRSTSQQDATISKLTSLPVKQIAEYKAKLPSIVKPKAKTEQDKQAFSDLPFGHYYTLPDESVKIWTKGEFEIKDKYPYFTNLSDYAIIIIEIRDAAGKKNQLVVKKYNYNGWVTKNTLKSDIKVKEGETVLTWVGNKRRKATTVQHLDNKSVGFLANQNSGVHGKWKTWMMENIGEVAQKMKEIDNESIWKIVEKSDKKGEWHEVVGMCLQNSFFRWIEPASRVDFEKMVAEKNAFLSSISHKEIENKRVDAFYGKWEEENRIIEIWTRGDFDVQSGFPYFVNLSSKNLIIIRRRAKEKAKKCCEELFIQRLPFYGQLGKKDGIPINVGENIYTYKGENWRKARYTLTSSHYGGFKFSDKKKTYREALREWKEMGIADLVQKMQTDTNFLQPITEGTWHWEQMTNTEAGVPGLGHILYTPEDKWQKIVQAYEIKQTLGKQKNKEQANLVQLPSSYVPIPSGRLIKKEQGEIKEVSIQGFYMSETEITNKQYREFLTAMERRGKQELLKRVRVYNENWGRSYSYGEPINALINTYHLHPAYNKYPVINVTHEGAQAYCQWLTELYNEVNKSSGWQVEFRLPNKEEWMYAAKGGHELAYYPWGGYNVRNAKGCYLGNFKQIDESKLIFDSETNTFTMSDTSATFTGEYISASGIATVDSFFPNDYGLYHMSGNAAEMLQAKGSTKGGSWNSTGYHVRIDAEDEYAGWEEPNPYIGFRPIVVVRKK